MAAWTILTIGISAVWVAAAPDVSLEIFMEEGVSATAAQVWARRLDELRLDNVRLRGRAAGDKVEATNVGTEEKPRYRVTGRLAADGTLHLPKARYSVRDAAGLGRYLGEIARAGTDAVTQEPAAFGLLPKQVEQVKKDLALLVSDSTAGKPSVDVASQILSQLPGTATLSKADRQALAECTVQEELRGMACGTALAVVLRPAGLALAPAAAGKGVRYQVARGDQVPQIWPIGWEPDAPPRETLPAILEVINVEIDDAPLDETLATVAGRLRVPVFYDRNALARHGVDLHQKVSLPSGRMMYAQIIRKLLTKARLKYELRIDDAAKPFLWVTTLKPITAPAATK